jgi:hypothetical protein
MSIQLLLPAIVGLACLGLFAWAIVYRPRPHDIDNVILSARKLDVSDLEVLLDAASEWDLRRAVTQSDLREVQEDRMRLAREYLKRVAFNSNLIQLWIVREHQRIQGKKRDDYTEADLLIVEALQLATELRFYSMAASLRMWLWMGLKVYRWPAHFVPSLADLREQCGINVIEKYRRLTGLAVALSEQHGSLYRDRLVEAL